MDKTNQAHNYIFFYLEKKGDIGYIHKPIIIYRQ